MPLAVEIPAPVKISARFEARRWSASFTAEDCQTHDLLLRQILQSHFEIAGGQCSGRIFAEETKMNSPSAGLRVAGIIFALVALAHAWRLWKGIEVVIGRQHIPAWPSVCGLVLAAPPQSLDVETCVHAALSRRGRQSAATARSPATPGSGRWCRVLPLGRFPHGDGVGRGRLRRPDISSCSARPVATAGVFTVSVSSFTFAPVAFRSGARSFSADFNFSEESRKFCSVTVMLSLLDRSVLILLRFVADGLDVLQGQLQRAVGSRSCWSGSRQRCASARGPCSAAIVRP